MTSCAHSASASNSALYLRLPSQIWPLSLISNATLCMSQGPRHPDTVSWTFLRSPKFFHKDLRSSMGTSLRPRSIRPQQQPLQTITCARLRLEVAVLPIFTQPPSPSIRVLAKIISGQFCYPLFERHSWRLIAISRIRVK